MTKVRDIAAFLGKTEAFNTTNKRLAFDSNEISTLTPTIATDIINQYGVVVYNTVDSLPASPSDGDRAWVTGNNRFYIADSSWHNALLVNVPPTINIANYDSVLTDSQSLTMTIEVTDSFENLDIITFGATLSPSNITDSAVLSFSQDSSVIALAINPDSANNATSFQITFTANDQINLASSVKSFTIDKGFVLTLMSQVVNTSGGTIINIDSDVAGGEFQLTSGDVLSLDDGSLNATVSSAKFLDNTQQSRTFIGSLYGATVGNQGTGYFALQQDGTFSSSHIGRVVSFGSSETTAASRFRTGNSSGGQTITGYTNQTHSVTTTSTTTSPSANSPHIVFGFPLKSMHYLGRASLLIAQGYGTLGPILANGTYTFNSNGTSTAAVSFGGSNRQGQAVKQHNSYYTASSYFDYISVNITYWNGRSNYMEYLNTSNPVTSTYFRCQYDRTSYFQTGKVMYSSAPSGVADRAPNSREILEGKCLMVASSSYNSSTNETTVYCGNQFGLQINTLHEGGGFVTHTFTTGSVSPAKSIGWWISKSAQQMQFTEYNLNNTSLDITYNQQVQGVYMNTARDLNFYEVTTTTTTTNTPYYKVQTQASPAGNGTNINLGTSSGSMYTWEKETAVTVDDNTGFSASDDIYLKE